MALISSGSTFSTQPLTESVPANEPLNRGTTIGPGEPACNITALR